MSFLIYLLLLAIPIYFLFIKKGTNKEEEPEKEKEKKSKKNKKEQSQSINQQSPSMISQPSQLTQPKPKQDSPFINSFREFKTLLHHSFAPNAEYVLFHDEKKFCLTFLSNPLSKDIKRYSKSVDSDVIAHVSYAQDKNLVVVGLKNSKEVLFYNLGEDENGKLKFKKGEKSLSTLRKFDIKQVAVSADAEFIATSGFGQDTSVQVFSTSQMKLIGTVEINEFENIEMKMSPDSKYITVTTFMYEIAVIAITQDTYHVKNSQSKETSVKIEKKNSVGNIKLPISCYEFTNNKNIFFVITNDGKFKIFHIYGAFNESRISNEIQLKASGIIKGSLLVLSGDTHKVQGYLCYSIGNTVVLLDVETEQELKRYEEIIDSDIQGLKLIECSGKIYFYVVSRDGWFNLVDSGFERK